MAARGGPAEGPRFLVDGMAVKLGKYLRCLGYDAAWDVRARTRALARRAAAEGRVLLTRSTRVGFEVEPPPGWLRLESEDPVLQLRQVVEALGLDVGARLFTRCIRCNLELVRVEDRERVAEHVPSRVFERHQTFFCCRGCGTVFWWGTHVERTCRKLGLPVPRAGRAPGSSVT